MHDILVATDGSAAAQRAVQTAAELARALDAALTIVTVQEERPLSLVQERFGEVEYNDILGTVRTTTDSELGRLYQRLGVPAAVEMTDTSASVVNRAISERILSQSEAVARAAGAPRVKSAMAWGDPAKAILDEAGRAGADLIVMGRRGLGRFSELLIGSISQKVLHHAPVKVLIVA
jgi:nucleotide-binding universal stress UspA family protein